MGGTGSGVKGQTNPNSLANLRRGNEGNRGGGPGTIEARETKQAFIDAINNAAVDASGKTVDEVQRAQLAKDLMGKSWRYTSVRQWWTEFQHGKPNAKVEHTVDDSTLIYAFIQALHEEGVDDDLARRVLDRVQAVIVADVE